MKSGLVTSVILILFVVNAIVINSTPSKRETSLEPRFLKRMLKVAVSPLDFPFVMEVENPEGIIAEDVFAVEAAVVTAAAVVSCVGAGVTVGFGFVTTAVVSLLVSAAVTIGSVDAAAVTADNEAVCVGDFVTAAEPNNLENAPSNWILLQKEKTATRIVIERSRIISGL